jgi:hypothetical protein
MGSMRKVIATVATISVAALGIASQASAFEGGGRKPSDAPLVSVGQHYTGELTNRESDTNYGGRRQVALWRLPPLTVRDVITVDWHTLPFTDSPGEFPICLAFAQGIDDFNWGGVFEVAPSRTCGNGPGYGVSASGSTRTEITAQETNLNSSYLEFYDYARRTNPSEFETFPYDFSVEPPLHYLGLAIRQVKRVSASGLLYASASLANGLPAPDGLTFSLAVTWPGGGTASSTGTGSGGTIGFQLALPETAYGKTATFVVSHPADGAYQGASSPKVQVLVAKPKTPPPSPCLLAEQHALSLKRQYKRLAHHARQARGAARAVLSRRAARVKRKLHSARLQAKSACGV